MKASNDSPDIQELRVFDSCVTLGRVVLSGMPKTCPDGLPDVAAVLAMLDRYAIEEALVHEQHARLVCPRSAGNRELMDAIRGEKRLHPVWVLEPPLEPGPGPTRSLADEMLEAGARVARLPMGKVSALPWHWDELCAALEAHRVPCFLDFGGPSTTGDLTDASVDGIRQIAMAHPDLPLVLSHIMGGRGVHPAVVPLVSRLPNLYIDTTGIIEYWRQVARIAGPERVLFATGAPFTDPGILISNVQYEPSLDRGAKALICGGNLRRLIEEVKP